jgi:hypothetical protein
MQRLMLDGLDRYSLRRGLQSSQITSLAVGAFVNTPSHDLAALRVTAAA